MFWYAVLILIAWGLNAFADAIDHSKGCRYLYELWHIVKFLSYGVLIGVIMWEHMTWWCAVLTVVNAWIIWRWLYVWLRKIGVDGWDDRLRIPWLAKIWDIDRTRVNKKQHAQKVAILKAGGLYPEPPVHPMCLCSVDLSRSMKLFAKGIQQAGEDVENAMSSFFNEMGKDHDE